MTRNPRQNRPPPASLQAVAITAQDKGGEGKSLTALALADRAQLSSLPIGIIQVDDQGRLPLLLGPEVVTIRIDPRLTWRDPSAELRA